MSTQNVSDCGVGTTEECVSRLSEAEKAALRVATAVGWRTTDDESAENDVLGWGEEIRLQAEKLNAVLAGKALPVCVCDDSDELVCVPVEGELGTDGALKYLRDLMQHLKDKSAGIADKVEDGVTRFYECRAESFGLLPQAERSALAFAIKAGWRDTDDEDAENTVFEWAEEVRKQSKKLKAILCGAEIPVSTCFCCSEVISEQVEVRLGDHYVALYVDELEQHLEESAAETVADEQEVQACN